MMHIDFLNKYASLIRTNDERNHFLHKIREFPYVIELVLTGLWRSVLSNMIAQVSMWQASRKETISIEWMRRFDWPTDVNVVGLQSRYRAAKKCKTRSRSCASPMIVNCLTNFLNARSSVSPWKLNNFTYSSATNWLKSFLKINQQN